MEQPSESATLHRDTTTPRSGSDSISSSSSSSSSDNSITHNATKHDNDDSAIDSDGEEDQPTPRPTSPATPSHQTATSNGTATPPYWHAIHRTTSTASEVSISAANPLRPSRINLEDHTDENHEVGRACWARQVSIDEYVVVGGGAIAGAYVVWNCTVETLKGGCFVLRKRSVLLLVPFSPSLSFSSFELRGLMECVCGTNRYSEFDTLRQNLVLAFPHSAASIPELPRKSVICMSKSSSLVYLRAMGDLIALLPTARFRPKFLEQRKAGLSHFLK